MSDIPLGARAIEVTLATAESEAPFHVYRPHFGMTTDSNVSRVWLRLDSDSEVALLYRSGVTAFIGPSQLGDPGSFFETQMGDGVDGETVTFGGSTALLMYASSQYGGGLDMVVNGIEVQVIGSEGGRALSSDDLRQIAESIA